VVSATEHELTISRFYPRLVLSSQERRFVNIRTLAILISTSLLMLFYIAVLANFRFLPIAGFNIVLILPITINAASWVLWTQISLMNALRQNHDQEFKRLEREFDRPPESGDFAYFEATLGEAWKLRRERHTAMYIELMAGGQMAFLALAAIFYLTRLP